MTAYFSDADIPEGLKGVFERSGVSPSLADITLPDCPLVAVNDAFCEMTGYDPEDVLNRNCRFLQPSEGAGPVRERMRHFLEDDRQGDAKFVIPNVRKDGSEFLNLLYMSKLTKSGEMALVLGSQFAFDTEKGLDPAIYDRALTEDLRQLNLLTKGHNWEVLGSLEALASSNSIIAQSRFD